MVATRTQPDLDFPGHVERLTAWLCRSPNANPFREVRIFEARSGGPRGPMSPVADLALPAAFAATRWPSILDDVGRLWVNLTACGVTDGVLVAAVEWVPAEHAGERPTRPVTVVLSGSTGTIHWLYG